MKHAITLLADQAQKQHKAQEHHLDTCLYYERILAATYRDMEALILKHKVKIAEIEKALQTEHDSAVLSRETLSDMQQALQAIAKEAV